MILGRRPLLIEFRRFRRACPSFLEMSINPTRKGPIAGKRSFAIFAGKIRILRHRGKQHLHTAFDSNVSVAQLWAAMKTVAVLSLVLTALSAWGASTAIPPDVIQDAFKDRVGTFVLLDCASGTVFESDPALAGERLPPCSTFKIWNTLIGLEAGVISDPSEAFYEWDGEIRSIPSWNQDLTLQQAFQESCVPAYQALAREIGQQRMLAGVEKLGYGDGDMASGLDIFWLPAEGRKPILISPVEQASLLCRLAAGKVPFSESAQNTLKKIMQIRVTAQGTLYGKTGSGMNVGPDGKDLGWFVGFIESKGSLFAFACLLKGEGLMGKDARAVTEHILEKQGLL